MAWERIKREGNEAKKAQQRKRMHQRASGSQGRSPYTAHVPGGSRSPAHRKFKQMTTSLTGETSLCFGTCTPVPKPLCAAHV